MTTMFMLDADYSPEGINRRLAEELARRGIKSETEAGRRFGKPQQWVSRHLTGATAWKQSDLHEFCVKLDLSYPYVVLGIREQRPTPPGTVNGMAAGQLIQFPATPSRATQSLDDELVDEDASRYVALSENGSPRVANPTGPQPNGCRPTPTLQVVNPRKRSRFPVNASAISPVITQRAVSCRRDNLRATG